MNPTAAPTKTKPAPRFDSPQQEAYLSLWRTYDRLKALEDRLFEEHGLSAQQYNALRVLAAALPGTVPVLTLGSRLISRAPDMTRLVDRLHRRGLVRRQRRQDNRRVVEVGITAEGLALLDRLADDVCRCHHEQLGHLSARQLADLNGLLALARDPHEPDSSPWKGKTRRKRRD